MKNNSLENELKSLWEKDDEELGAELLSSLASLKEEEVPARLRTKLLAIPAESAENTLRYFLKGLTITVPTLAVVLMAVILPTSPTSPSSLAGKKVQISAVEREDILVGITESLDGESFDILDEEFILLEEVL